MYRTLGAAILGSILVFSSLPNDAEARHRNCLLTFVQKAEDQSIEKGLQYPTSVFRDSILRLVPTAMVAIATSEMLRHLNIDPTTFPKDFWINAPIDVAITAVTHMISTKHTPILDELLSHKSAPVKIGANIVFGTAGIATGWQIAGIPYDHANTCAALGLCSAVYPVLFGVKHFLYKRLFTMRDRNLAMKFNDESPAFAEVIEAVVQRAAGVGIERIQAERMAIPYLDGLVLSIPYEDENRVRGLMRYDESLRDIIASLRELDIEHEADEAKSALKYPLVVALRRQLVNRLLELHDKHPHLAVGIEQILSLSQDSDDDFSMDFHRALNARSNTHWMWAQGRDIIDQVISVGICGGVFLYNTTHGARTGYFREVFEQLKEFVN